MTGARSNDPPTSWKSAAINQRYRDGQRFALLLAHARAWAASNGYGHRGMTADECAIAANLNVPCNGGTGKACYWKRHSELLREFGYLEEVRVDGRQVERRLDKPGACDQMALRISTRGLAHVQEVLSRYS